MKTIKIFSIILVIAFSGSFTNVFALNEKRNDSDKIELSTNITSIAQQIKIKVLILKFKTSYLCLYL